MVTPVRPTKPRTSHTKNKAAVSNGGGSAGKKSSGGGGGGGGGGNSARAAERRAVSRENATKRKAGKRYIEAANNLELQAKAIRHALKIDFKKARDQNLGDLGQVLTSQLSQLKLGQGQRAQTFLSAAKNTEMATAGQAEQGYANLTRERADSLSSILEQGAGETDTMRALLISARNWHANASEGNRAYFDSMQSVNQGIVDLNIDTRNAMANAYTSAEGEKDRLWQEFYNKRSESFSQLGNTMGQKADYYAQAKEMGVKPKKGMEKKAEKEMAKSYMDMAKESGKSYVQKKLPDWIGKYAGTKAVEAKLTNTTLGAGPDLGKVEKAEGATLKKWEKS